MTSQGDSSEPRFPYVWVHLESLDRNKSWGCDISSLKCFLRQNFLAILLFSLTSPTVLLIIAFCFFLETALMWPLNVFKPQDWRCFVDPVGHVLPASESRPRMHLKPVWALFFLCVFVCLCVLWSVSMHAYGGQRFVSLLPQCCYCRHLVYMWGLSMASTLVTESSLQSLFVCLMVHVCVVCVWCVVCVLACMLVCVYLCVWCVCICTQETKPRNRINYLEHPLLHPLQRRLNTNPSTAQLLL